MTFQRHRIQASPSNVPEYSLPSISCINSDEFMGETVVDSRKETEIDGLARNKEQISVVRIDDEDNDPIDFDGLSEQLGRPGLVTLSGQPASRWANLPHLNLIRERNKPIEPPKKPKNAPFFLPTVVTQDGFEFNQKATDQLIKEEGQENSASSISTPVLMARRQGNLNTPWNSALIRLTFSIE